VAGPLQRIVELNPLAEAVEVGVAISESLLGVKLNLLQGGDHDTATPTDDRGSAVARLRRPYRRGLRPCGRPVGPLLQCLAGPAHGRASTPVPGPRFQDEQVTFRYTHSRTGQTRQMSLPVHHFLARFLQPVLPRGYAKIRYYGLLSPGCRADIKRPPIAHSTSATLRPGFAYAGPCQSHSHLEPGRSTSSEATSPASSLEIARRCPFCEHGSLPLLRVCHRPRAPPG
jgi:hypothetical protein